MKLNRALFNNKNYVVKEEVDLSKEQFDPYHIRRVEKCEVEVKGKIVEDLLLLDVVIDAEVVGVCSVTLEDIPLKLHIVDDIQITNDKENEDDFIFFEKDNIFDFDPYILSIIVSEVPLFMIKDGVKLPEGDDKFRVIDEDQYEEEKKNKKDDRWSKLDDIEL